MRPPAARSSLVLPEPMDYDGIAGLSQEVREILKRARPETLGAAGRLSGITPASLVALLGYVKRQGPPGRASADHHGLSGTGEDAPPSPLAGGVATSNLRSIA